MWRWMRVEQWLRTVARLAGKLGSQVLSAADRRGKSLVCRMGLVRQAVSGAKSGRRPCRSRWPVRARGRDVCKSLALHPFSIHGDSRQAAGGELTALGRKKREGQEAGTQTR